MLPRPDVSRRRALCAITTAVAVVLAGAGFAASSLRFSARAAFVLDGMLLALLVLAWTFKGPEAREHGGIPAPIGSLLILFAITLDFLPTSIAMSFGVPLSLFAKVGGVALLAIVADRCRRLDGRASRHGAASLDALELLREPLLGVDASGRVVYQSQAARPLVGRDVARARMPLSEVLNLEGVDTASALAARAHAPGGFCCHGQLLGTKPRDVIVTVHSAEDFRTPSGAPLAAIVQLVDITVARRAQDRLSQMSAPQSLVRHLTRIAHELNNPLSALCGASELLESGSSVFNAASALHSADGEAPDPQEAADPLVAGILRNAARCRGIVRRVLSLVKGVKEGRTEVELNQLADQFSEDFRAMFTGHGVTLRVMAAATPCVVWSSRAGLEEVLINLVSNACAALKSQRGGTVHVIVRNEDGKAGFDVEDDGPGIPDLLRDRVFDEFVSGRKDGTGIGLAICREIVEECGGTIKAERREPVGTRMRIRMPVATRANGDQNAALPAVRTNQRALRILAVDDEPLLRLVLERFLTREGHSVVVAEGGIAAREHLLAETFDAVVSDRAMPELDGDSLYREVVGARPEYRGRFLFLSGSAFEGLPEEASRDGCLLVSKPFEEADLIGGLRKLTAIPTRSLRG